MGKALHNNHKISISKFSEGPGFDGSHDLLAHILATCVCYPATTHQPMYIKS